MSFYFNGTSSNVSITGGITASIPAPSSTQTFKSINATGTGASQTIYTPSGSKIFYLYGVSIGTAGSFQVYAYDGTTLMAYGGVVAQGTAQGGLQGCITGGACPIAFYDNSHPLKANCSNGVNVCYFGVEI